MNHNFNRFLASIETEKIIYFVKGIKTINIEHVSQTVQVATNFQSELQFYGQKELPQKLY